MKKLNAVEAAQELAKTLKKPILYISFDPFSLEGDDPFTEQSKSAPYLDPLEDIHLMMYNEAIIICNDDEELKELFWQTVGDDGPTETNPYDGPARTYALTINSRGEMLNENT
jgi:hypothetical protein